MNMIDIHHAFDLIHNHWPEPSSELIGLEDCSGRVLSEDVFSKVTAPPFDASAMDGFAVRFSDVGKAGTRLDLLGEVPAGAPNMFSLRAGECVRVFTGSPMPEGADHVLIQEHADLGNSEIHVNKAQYEARHIRRAGGDFCIGDKVLKRGTRLTYSEIGLAAAANHSSLPVFIQPHFAIMTTGSELRAPGEGLEPGQIVESNSISLAHLLGSEGARVSRLPIAMDDEASILSRFEEASDADIILTVGGASVGKHDLVRGAFARLGGELIFERIGVRPGKPTWLGRLGDQIVIGLPGNPTAAVVIASLLIKPRLQFDENIKFTQAFLATDTPANGARETYARARLVLENGTAKVYSLKDQDTSRVQVLTSTNCLLHRPAHDAKKLVGDLVNIVSLE